MRSRRWFGLAIPAVSEVVPGVWCIRHRAYLTCSYLVATAEGTYLVDAGRDSHAADIFFAYASLGLAPATLRGILLTHWHNDHAAGAAALAARTGAPVYYHAAEAPYCTRQTAPGGVRDFLANLVPEWGVFLLAKGLIGDALPRAVAAARHIAEGDVIDGRFRVVATPGHTRGHVSFLLAEQSILFSGDALAVIDGAIRLMARPTNIDLDAARTSIQRLHAESYDVLCPGHREPLVRNVRARAREFEARTTGAFAWPLFG